MLRFLERWAVDGRLVFVVFLLTVFGIAMVYSAGAVNTPTPDVVDAWRKQALWFGLALVTFSLTARIPLPWWEWIAVPAYVLSLVLLAATLVIGTGAGTAESTKSWIGFGGFRFQPSELAKIATVLALARLLANRQEPPTGLRDLFAPGLLVGAPLGFTLLEGDLGSALAFIGLLYTMLYWAGTPPFLLIMVASPVAGLFLSFDTRIWSGYIVILFLVLYLYRYRLFLYESAVVILVNIAAGAIASPLWNSLKPYQQNRLLVFLDPTVDPRGAGYNLMQSKVAIGSGGLTGKGYLLGTQKRFDFLPEQHTDFIFSVVGEELGFLGAGLALITFGYILYRLVRMAEEANDPFAGLVLFGIFGVWLVHIFVNVGMTVGLVPITGIPLPFVSYGGTFLLTCWLAVAMAARLAHEE
ncbi:MAG: rod shape-determining protein RodA [Gemmatimonadetes bacterium]|nr:rod shape-determining protein RodA [Gemmatimonadota bacterium]